jgi:hypothetical protein
MTIIANHNKSLRLIAIHLDPTTGDPREINAPIIGWRVTADRAPEPVVPFALDHLAWSVRDGGLETAFLPDGIVVLDDSTAVKLLTAQARALAGEGDR